jgi:hypothetical protein
MQSSVHQNILQCYLEQQSYFMRNEGPLHQLIDITNQCHRGHDEQGRSRGQITSLP